VSLHSYCVTVLFTVQAEKLEEFTAAVLNNARLSLEVEPGCRVFDVCVGPTDPTVFLYELYDSADAFAQHLASAHFIDFNETTTGWTVSKSVTIYDRISDWPAGGAGTVDPGPGTA